MQPLRQSLAQQRAEARRERKLAQSSMEELWRMLYKYSSDPNAEKAERIEGHPNDAARRREAVSELVALTRGRCVPGKTSRRSSFVVH